MSAIDEITRAEAASPLPGPGGWAPLRQTAVEVRARGGLSRDEIEELETETGIPLPRELVSLLGHTAGVDGVLGGVDFTGRTLEFEDRDVFHAGIPIAADGLGNFWVLDVTPADTEVAPVFYASHDPPMVLFQSPSLEQFLRELFGLFVPPHASSVDDVHEDRLFGVWRSNPRLLDHAAALEGDEALRAFATELDGRFELVDLRRAEIGMGFSWGRFGPRTIVRRHGYERLFACAAPAAGTGVLRRLTGTLRRRP